jgi:hypothetical protein
MIRGEKVTGKYREKKRKSEYKRKKIRVKIGEKKG